MGTVKVTLNNNTLIDITDTTAVASDVASGKYYYAVNGNKTAGTASGGGGQAETDLKNIIEKATTANLTIPSGTTTIEKYTFYQYTGLQGITIPSGVTSIEERAFYQCTGLTNVTFPNSITTIGLAAFSNCTNLTPSALPSQLTTLSANSFTNCASMAVTSLPSGVTTIPDSCFSGCYALALSSLPSTVTSVGEHSFQDCRNLSWTSLPNTLTTIGSYAFDGCSKLALTSLPNTLTTINQYAFRNCVKLDITTLPDTVVSIGANSLQGCSKLSTLTCNGAITSLGSTCFTGNSTNRSNLTEIRLPNLTAITVPMCIGQQTQAYANQSLVLADLGGANALANYALGYCSSLTTLILRKTSGVCTITTSSLYRTPLAGYNGGSGTVYVPQNLIDSYKSANYWSNYYNNGAITFVAIEGSPYELS